VPDRSIIRVVYPTPEFLQAARGHSYREGMDTGAGTARHARNLAAPELSRETAADVALAVLPMPPPRHRADPRPAVEVRAPVFDPVRFEVPLPRRAEDDGYFTWPASPALDLWALRIRLEAACRRGESRQGWVPCRVIRQAIRTTG
jgi:hypothetical protein